MLKIVAQWMIAVFVAGALFAAQAPSIAAHEGYPIMIEAKYQEIKRGGTVKRMIFVNGHAHYPNGTRIAVGLRLEEQQQYLAWYNGVVKNQAFIVEMGPWNKDFASGLYIVEGWFLWERQPSTIQGAIKKAEDGLERGVDNCDADVVKDRKRCKTKSVFGACVLQVGTPGRFLVEEEETRSFLSEVNETLVAVYGDVEQANKEHSDAEKAAEVNAEAWKIQQEDWNRRLQEVDGAVIKWHQSKLTVRHQRAYTASANAVMNIQALYGSYGEKLYQLPNDFLGSGSIDAARAEVQAQLAVLLEDLKAPAEEGGDEGGNGKGEGGTGPKEK